MGSGQVCTAATPEACGGCSMALQIELVVCVMCKVHRHIPATHHNDQALGGRRCVHILEIMCKSWLWNIDCELLL